jgi:uncharacterized repeat protein (TIGR01451 family)
MRTWITFLLVLTSAMSAWAQPASCAAPGKDGVNYSAPSYYSGNATAVAGQNTIQLGTIRTVVGTDPPTNSGAPGTTALTPGDLVLIIQMQDVGYNNSNGTAYGDGSAGRGWTAINNAGRYEFRRVVSFSGGNLVVDAPLSFTYTRANPTAGTGANENGNRRFQVVRVPQFSNVTLPGGTIAPPHWDGETGGVFVIDVTNTLNMNNTTVEASAMGFRGGGGWPTYPLVGFNVTSYVNTRTFNTTVNAFCSTNYDSITTTIASADYANVGGSKGEGIAGTPRLVRRQAITNSNTYETPFAYRDLTTVGYANGGFLARGAPGNAGGGGTQHNSGGGGGSNVGQGGQGGNSFAFYRNPASGTCVQFTGGNPNPFNACDGDLARGVGGLGGGTLAASIDRLIMGGGGGSGDANNNCDSPALPQTAGGNGGGIIFIRAGAIAGAGTLLANGQNGLPGGRDSAGGGGAGGTVVVLTATTNPALTVRANGGQGGNTAHSGTGGVPGVLLRAGETQGPAGGGGGGSVVRSSNVAGFTTVTFVGGASGVNFPVSGNTGVFNTYGAGSGGGAAATVPFLPTSPSIDANCLPSVSASKRTTTPLVAFPQSTTAQYVITLSNAGPGGAVGATLVDTLQTPFQYNPTASPINQIGLTYAGGSDGPASPTTGTGTQTFRVGTAGSNSTTNSFYLAPNSTVSFTVTVQVNGGGVTPTFGTVYQNTVTLSFLDPFRTGATTTVSPGGAYTGTTTTALGSNYNANSSTQENVTVLAAVNLAITKTNGINSPTTVVAGQTFNYTITVANIGGTASVDLVNGLLRDPSALGLVCTAVSCIVPAGSTSQCPAPAAVTLANLQGAGITIPLLRTGIAGPPPPNRLEFVVTCGVTATGL